MPHEPVYLTEEQIAEIAELNSNIQQLIGLGLPVEATDSGIATLEAKIEAIKVSAPAGTPKKACITCITVTHCPDCGNPVDSAGLTTAQSGIAYHPDEEPVDD